MPEHKDFFILAFFCSAELVTEQGIKTIARNLSQPCDREQKARVVCILTMAYGFEWIESHICVPNQHSIEYVPTKIQ